MSEVPMHTLPGRRSLGYFDWPRNRLIWVASFVMLGLATYWNGFIALMFLVIGAVGAMPTHSGYGYQLLPQMYRGWKQMRQFGEVFTQDFDDTLVELDSTPQEKSQRERRRPFQVKLEGVPVPSESGNSGILGLISNPHTDQDTIIVEGLGWGEAATGDPIDRMITDQNLGSTLKNLANMSESTVTMSLIFSSRPPDRQPAAEFLGERIHPDVWNPKTPEDEALKHARVRTLDAIYDRGTKTRMAISLTAKRPRSWHKGKLDELPLEDIRDAPINHLSAILKDGLIGNGVKGVKRLGLLDLNAFVHGLFDIADIENFYEDLAVDRKAEREGLLSRPEESLTLMRGPWPRENRSAVKSCSTDGTYHRMLVLDNLQQTSVPAGFFQRMLTLQGVWYTITVSAHTVPVKADLRKARDERAKQLARTSGTNRRGDQVLSRPQDEVAAAAADRHHHELYMSGSKGVRYQVVASVSAESLQALDHAEKLFHNHFRQMRMVFEPVRGRARQMPALLSTLGVEIKD